MRNNFSITNVYEGKTTKSKISTQLLYGDNFKKLKDYKSWIKIKNKADGYKGYIKNKNFSKEHKYTHKINSLFANTYLKPSVKFECKNKLSFGSRIKVVKKKGSFYKFDNMWIKKVNLKNKNFKTKDIFKNIKKFSNVKYKWGGKNFNGIDCSGLVQVFLNFNNKYCPRDAKDQIKYFKKKINLKNIKRGDLIFWKGHVAIAISNKKLIHAYGPLKKTLVMPIKKTINRIYNTAALKVIGIRRVL